MAAQGRTGRPRVQTSENVVSEAIALVEEEGLGSLTMAGLARRLGIGTMTLYGYVASRDELIDQMVARLLDQQPTPPALTEKAWVDSLVTYMGTLRTWAVERPALLHLRAERPRLTDDVARHVSGDLDALVGLGFTPAQAITIRHTLTVHLQGQVEYELARRRPTALPSPSAALPATLAAGLEYLQSTDPAELYATAVRSYLTGFSALLRARASTRRPANAPRRS